MAIKRGSKRWNEAMKDMKTQMDKEGKRMRQTLLLTNINSFLYNQAERR